MRDHIKVPLDQITLNQATAVVAAYGRVAEKLAEVDRMHRDKFKETPLEQVFPTAMDYFFEKMGRGILAYSYGDREFGLSNVRRVQETYQKFAAALDERNELNEYTKYDLDEYNHALARVEEFRSGKTENMEEADARIYLAYLRHEHEHFLQLAKEIDEQYRA